MSVTPDEFRAAVAAAPDTEVEGDEDAYVTGDEGGGHDEEREREADVQESIMQTV